MLHIINVLRFDYRNNHTKSMVFLDNQFFCYGLEPECLAGLPIFGERDCVPVGTYKVELSYSNRFKLLLPEIKEVPMNAGIRIHAGNSFKDTSGCLLLGEHFDGNMLVNSKIKIDTLLFLMKGWKENGESCRIIFEALKVNSKSCQILY